MYQPSDFPRTARVAERLDLPFEIVLFAARHALDCGAAIAWPNERGGRLVVEIAGPTE